MHLATRKRIAWLLHAALIAAIVGLGVHLRLHNLEIESVYWDEFSSLIHLAPPAGYADSPYYDYWQYHVIRKEVTSVWEFWKANRELDPATMPLYYTMEFYVWKWGGQDVVTLRMLSVILSVLAFPFIYLLGRAMWGPAAGAVALFMFAASPVHVQFAQEIRMYSLFFMLASASAYTFYKLVEHPARRWWTTHLLLNFLLFWTHPFAVWLPFVEGLFLCFFHWNRWHFVLTWGIAHVVLLLPSAYYISTIQFFGEETTSEWMVLPGTRALLCDIFADDFVGLTSQLWGRGDAMLAWFSRETVDNLVRQKMVYGIRAAIFVTGLGLCCVLWQACRFFRAWTQGEAWTRWKWAAFLVMWALLPPLILIFLSVVWRPMIMPRYTLHCSLAFYLLAGGAIQALRWNVLRVVPVALIVLIYAYEQGLVYAGPHRTDWMQARDFLKENADEDDLILVENWLWRRVFTYTMGPVPQVIGYATDADTLAELARLWLDSAYPLDPANPEPRGLWVVIQNGYFNAAPPWALEKELAERGMMWRKTFFYGIEGLWIYEVADAPMLDHASRAGWEPHQSYATDFEDLSMAFWVHKDYANGACIAEAGLATMPMHPRLWSYLGMNLKEMGEWAAARAAFEEAVSRVELDYPWSLTNLGECCIELDDFDCAIRWLTRAVEVLPGDARPRWLLARAYIEAGQPWEALQVLEEVIAAQYWEPMHWEMIARAHHALGAMAGGAR